MKPGERFGHAAAASLLLACLIATGAPALAAPDPQAAKHYETALARYEKKDIAGAINALRDALQIDRTLLPAQILLGKALLSHGQAAAAEVALTEALRRGANRAEVIVPLARAHVAQGKPQLVIEGPQFSPTGLPVPTQVQLLVVRAEAAGDLGDTRQALQAIAEAKTIGPQVAEVALAEVPLRIRARQLREADEAADRALGLAPGSADAWYQKGAVLQARGAFSDALAAYARSIQADPDHAEARIARAGVQLNLGRNAEAAADLAELRRISPRDPRAAYIRALLAERANQPAEVRSALQEVTRLIDPVPFEFIRYRPQLLMLAGLAHFDLNERSKARPYLEAFDRIQGASPVSRILAQIHLGEREAAKAIAVLEAYLKTQPRDAAAINLLASAHMAMGHHHKATALVQEALRAQVTPELQTTLGLSLIGSGKSGDAMAHLEEAFRKDSGQTQAGSALVALYLRSGQAAKAVAVADAMVRKRPDNPTLIDLLGIAQAVAGNIAAARAAYEQALRIDPKLVAPKLNLARLDISVRDFDAAARRLGALLKENGKNIEALFEMAILSERRGQPAESLRWLEQAAEFEGPRQVRAGLALVDLHLRHRRPGPALEAAKRVSAKAPDDLTVLLALATAQLANGDAGSARIALTNASRFADYNAPLQVQVATLQLAAKDLAGARYSLEKALSGQAEFLPAQVLMAEVELRQGDYAKAERRARQMIEKNPKLAVGHRLLGDVALARDQVPAALEAYRRAHQTEPSTATLLRLFGVLARQDSGKPAIELGEQWLKTHPADTSVRRALADRHAAAGNLAAARSAYEDLIRVAPDDVAVMNNLANVLHRSGDPGATRLAEQAMARAPGNPDVIDTLGWILSETGQTDRALPLLRDARLRSPENPDIRYHLAVVLARIGRKSEARDELLAALKSGRAFEQRSEAEKLLRNL